MFKPAPVIVFAVVLGFMSLACSSSVAPVPDPNYIDTSVAQTLTAFPTSSIQPVTPVSNATVTRTFTPSPSPSPTLTPVPFIIFTDTPSAPLITVSVDTNCRTGPGQAYPRVGALLVGETTEVFGQNPTGTYWYVRNPDVENGFCWLWGEYATVSGDIQVLPVYTPPPTPTPTPAFDAEYRDLDTCSGWYLEFRLINTGSVPFRSFSITVLNHRNDKTLSSSENKFISHNGCAETAVLNSLAPGERIVISSPTFDYDPTGDKLLVTIRLCTDDDLYGTCVKKELNVKP